MIAILATIRVKEGQAEVFEDVFREAMGLVKQEEPGCLLYQLIKSRNEANTYKVMELYQNQAALDVHAKSEGMRAVFGKMGACMGGRPEIEYLDAVV